jgi:hypothetical protein
MKSTNIYHIIIGFETLIIIALGVQLASYNCKQGLPHRARVLEECIRASNKIADESTLIFGTTNSLCLDFRRTPLLEGSLSPCSTPGSVVVQHGVNIEYSNIRLEYVRPEHLCVTDSISENYIMCSRRSPKQHIHSDIIGRSTLQHVYTEWFSGHPDTCTHKIYINGGTGVCMRPSIRDPSVWNKENFVVLNDVRDDDSTLTCNTTAVHYATQEAQVYPGTPFHSIYFGTSVLRVANIKGKNVYIIGRPSKKQIEDGIDDHIKRIENEEGKDTAILSEQIKTVRTFSATTFKCSDGDVTITS